MNQELAPETYAVVVGIEQYQMGSNLSRDGAAKNVLQFTDWLLDCGIPENNLYLFISELEENKNLVAEYQEEKNVAIKEAIKDNIYKTIFDEIPTKQGQLLTRK